MAPDPVRRWRRRRCRQARTRVRVHTGRAGRLVSFGWVASGSFVVWRCGGRRRRSTCEWTDEWNEARPDEARTGHTTNATPTQNGPQAAEDDERERECVLLWCEIQGNGKRWRRIGRRDHNR